MIRKTSSTGFSLVEVSLAIVLAAGGLLTVFSLFPMALRQGAGARADMVESAFAESFFTTVQANISVIDDIADWNDFDTFILKAVKGTGVDGVLGGGKGKSYTQAFNDLSEGNKEAIRKLDLGDTIPGVGVLRYIYRESERENVGNGVVLLPPQFLMRVIRVENKGAASSSASTERSSGPAVYSITLVSSSQKAPAIFTGNSLYHSEFYFSRRP